MLGDSGVDGVDDDRLFTATETGTLNMHTLTRPTSTDRNAFHLETSKLVEQMGHAR